MKIVCCASCGHALPAHLAERWDGLSEEQAREEWRRLFRNTSNYEPFFWVKDEKTFEIEKEVKKRLSHLAQDMFDGGLRIENLLRPKKPVLLSELFADLQDGFQELYDDGLGVPWGIDEKFLFTLGCSSGMPSSSITCTCLNLDDGLRLYQIYDDWDNGWPTIIAAAEAASGEVTDQRFLQKLFQSNGETFGVGLVSGPPTEISFQARSLEFLVDIFWALFDSCPDCWEFLPSENYQDIWNEEYENPDTGVTITDAVLRQANDELKDKFKEMRGLVQNWRRHELIERRASEILKRDEPENLIHDWRFTKRKYTDPDEKPRVVARYLSRMLASG